MSVSTFRRGAPAPGAPFEAGLLPLSEKRSLCEMLLEEFRAEFVRHNERKSELTHPCLISPEQHKNQRRDPTASLNYDRLAYKCFGCGSGGGLLWFIATLRHCTTEEAARWLREEIGTAGVVLDLDKFLRYIEAAYARKPGTAVIPTYSARMLDPWNLIHPYLTDPPEMYGRGIPEANVVDLKVGYAEQYPLDDYGHVSERIVIPHFWKGNLVGWQTRRLDARDGTPKYLSSPDFPKDVTIYNYNPRNERAVVVEAALSVVTHYHAMPEMEATFGASITESQLNLLAKHSTVVLFTDNDKAGWDAIDGHDDHWPSGQLKEHHPGLAEKLGRLTNLLVVENPYAADPGDMSTEDVARLVRAAVPYSVWKRPRVLLCYRCKNTAHDGQCEGR